MRIIHCADLHLDSAMTSNLSPEKARERKGELLNAFNRMINYAVTNGVGAVIIAGDLFDTKKVSLTARNAVKNAIESNPEIRFYYLQGNHDAGSFLDSFNVLPENLKLFDDDWKVYCEGENGRICIYGMELNGGRPVDWYNRLITDPDKINIVVLHGQESESKTKDKTEIIPFSELRNKNIDYLALGHIHTFKKAKLDGRGIFCYPGCLEGRGFDEPGEHGFVMLEINEENGEIRAEFIPNAERRMYIVEADITDCMTTEEISAKSERVLKEKNIEPKHMVKLVLTGETDVNCEKDIPFIETRFRNSFYVFRVSDATKLRVDPEEYIRDESLKGEFVRTVLNAADLSDEERAEIIRCGINALKGEEIQL